MRILILICVLFCVNAEQIYRLPVPGCTVVELNSQYAECFTHSNGNPKYPKPAAKICEESGGRLAIVQHEKIWKGLIEKLLKPKGSQVWLGFSIAPQSTRLTPSVDLKNMSAYWQDSTRTTQYPEYIYAKGPRWDWWRYTELAQDYLCQYNVVMQCKVSEIVDPKVTVKTCVEENVIPNKVTLEIKCPLGYYLNTSKHMTCRNGIWDKSQCVAGCSFPLQRDNAILSTVPKIINVGDTVSYVCDDGYYNDKDFSKTHFTITCQHDSTWSDVDTSCSLRQEYNTININANEISTDTIKLDCDSLSNYTTWFHNGKEITSNSNFAVTEADTLRVSVNDINSIGFYTCYARLDENLRVGSKAYNVFREEKCKTELESSPTKETVCRERETVILNCPQDVSTGNNAVKWFKDGKKIIYNKNQNVLVGGELLLQNITAKNDGDYVCEITRSLKSSNCKRKITHTLRVILSGKTICGTKKATDPKYYQPWLAILWQDEDVEPFCFGTLLNEKWIVTSAFCLTHLRRRRNLDGVYAVLGLEGSRQKFPVSQIKIHPNYNTRPNVNDVGLIQLRVDAVKFDYDVVPACINSEDIGRIHACEDSSNLTGSVIGWGTKITDNIDDVTTNIADVKMISKKLCRNLLSCESAKNKFCTKLSNQGFSVVGGFGSPFTVKYNSREYVVGIYTWGKNDGDQHYAYFTSLLNYYDWIAKTINY